MGEWGKKSGIYFYFRTYHFYVSVWRFLRLSTQECRQLGIAIFCELRIKNTTYFQMLFEENEHNNSWINTWKNHFSIRRNQNRDSLLANKFFHYVYETMCQCIFCTKKSLSNEEDVTTRFASIIVSWSISTTVVIVLLLSENAHAHVNTQIRHCFHWEIMFSNENPLQLFHLFSSSRSLSVPSY